MCAIRSAFATMRETNFFKSRYLQRVGLSGAQARPMLTSNPPDHKDRSAASGHLCSPSNHRSPVSRSTGDLAGHMDLIGLRWRHATQSHFETEVVMGCDNGAADQGRAARARMFKGLGFSICCRRLFADVGLRGALTIPLSQVTMRFGGCGRTGMCSHLEFDQGAGAAVVCV